MKVKIFIKAHAETLEYEINAFLEQHNIVYIDCKTTSSELGLYVMIFYKEGENK